MQINVAFARLQHNCCLIGSTGAHNKTYKSIHKFTAESETATDLNNPTLTGLLNHKKRKQKEMDNILAGTYLNTALIN